METARFDRNGKKLAAHEAPVGLCGFTSWRRLSEIFRRAGEIRDCEQITGWQVDELGITFKVEVTT